MTEMAAGRELDELVYSAIRDPEDPTRCPICNWPLAGDVSQGCIKGNCSQRPIPNLNHPPRYSTEWYAMRLVIDKMRERGWDYIEMQCGTSTEWRVYLEKREIRRVGIAPTLPHAVCLAALKAVEAE